MAKTIPVLSTRSVPQIAVRIKPVRHQHDCLTAIAAGLKAAGYKVRETYDVYPVEKIVITWSWGTAMTLRAKNPSAIIYCMDHAYMPNRAKGVWQGGWSTPDMACGLNGWGEHAVVDDGGDRLHAKDWAGYLQPRLTRQRDKRLLFCGQVFGDAQIRGHVQDYAKWCRETVDRFQREGYKTTFRPHPVMVNRGTVQDYGNLGRISTNKSLWDDFRAHTHVAGFNSNAVAQGWMEGLEAWVASEGSMLWPATRPDGWADWEKRERWMARLAYCQWETEELRDGTWLSYHEPILHRLVAGGEVRPWYLTSL